MSSAYSTLVSRPLELILYGPVFLIVSLAIAVEAPGPILIRETRYGYQGPIRVFKFRPDVADRNRNTYYTTVVAQILHSSGVGQLPQLLNVLCGEMSIVGPHPDNSAREHSHSILYDVKPGMTGLAQMSENREELGSALQRIREDLRYVKTGRYSSTSKSFWRRCSLENENKRDFRASLITPDIRQLHW